MREVEVTTHEADEGRAVADFLYFY